jgi:hypothetical protein
MEQQHMYTLQVVLTADELAKLKAKKLISGAKNWREYLNGL